MLLKKIIIILGLSLSCIVLQYNSAYGQGKDDFLLIEAKLWTPEGDTISGLLEYMNQYTLQFNITLSDTVENSLKYFSPRDIAGYYFYANDEKVIFHSKDNPLNIGKVFLKLLYEGELSVYQYLELDQRTSYLSFLTHYFLWKDVWLEPEISVQFEKEALLKHFYKCPEIEYKIKTGVFGLKNIVELIQEYEKCQLTDDYEYFYE